MPGDTDNHKEMQDAIKAFEQILEVLPRDRGALEAVLLAGRDTGPPEAMTAYRMRLVDVLMEEGDWEAAREQIEPLRDVEEARDLLARYDREARNVGAAAEDPAKERSPGEDTRDGGISGAVRMTPNIPDELGLAWKLMEAGELSQEEYAGLARDLTDMSATESGGTVSALHVLETGRYKNLERVLALLARESRTPLISLSCFAMRSELAPWLPWEFMLQRGALVFGQLGQEVLVAVLNPFSRSLREDVRTLVRRPCHFFLARPSEFDQALSRLADHMVEPAQPES